MVTTNDVCSLQKGHKSSGPYDLYAKSCVLRVWKAIRVVNGWQNFHLCSTIALNLFKAWIAMIYVQLLTKILTSARHMASKGNFHHQPTSLSYETKKEPHWWKLLVHIIVPGLFYLYSVHTTGAMVGCCVQSETVLFTDLVIIVSIPKCPVIEIELDLHFV